ncbi:ABC transporter substrate-binding protein [Chloroflexota bacterium]
MKRFAILVGSVTLVALLANACVGPAAGPGAYEVDKWVLQVQIPLTGGWAGYGVEGHWAVQWCADEINANGGINGKPFELVVRNNQSDPDIAQAVMAEMLDANPLAVSICDGDTQGFAIAPLIVDEEVMCIMPVTGTPSASTAFPWSVSFLDWDENLNGPAEAEWLSRESDITKVVPSFNVESPSYHILAASSMYYIQENSGVEIGDPVTYEQFRTTEYSGLAVSLLAQDDGHTGFKFSSTGDPVAKMIIEMHKRGFDDNRRILIDNCADYPELFSLGEGYTDGCYLKTMYDVGYDGTRWVKIVADWYDTHDVEYGAYGITFSTDMPLYFKMAVEATGVTGDPAKLEEERVILQTWMRNQKAFPFITGAADVNDGIRALPMYLNTIENNKKVLLTPVISDWDDPLVPWVDASTTELMGW